MPPVPRSPARGSTVSIVWQLDRCRRARRLLGLAVVGLTLDRDCSADAADAADGTVGPRTDLDYPASGSAFTTKGNVNAQRPKKGLRAA